MADDDVDVVIVGSGFAGALIANELAKRGKKRGDPRSRRRNSAEYQRLHGTLLQVAGQGAGEPLYAADF